MDHDDDRGLSFHAEVRNGTEGHNVPTGFTAERIVFLRATVTDARGQVLYRSGDFDPDGDLRDAHSAHVQSGRIELDRDLFSLQSKFLTRNNRGGEREQILAVNYSLDPLPFIRPEPYATVLLGRNAGARLHKRGIEPLGNRVARYQVGVGALTGQRPYRIDMQLVAGMVPVNLVREVQGVGFDYGMSPQLVARNLLAGYMTLAERTVEAPGAKTAKAPGAEGTAHSARLSGTN